MKTLTLLTTLFLASWTGAVAQPDAVSIEVLATFDYPGEGNSTSAQGINDNGDIAGNFVDSSGIERGFIRYADGTFSDPIVEPKDEIGFTALRDINNSGTVGGTYEDDHFVTHAFLLSGTTFTELELPNSFLFGINDANDAVGYVITPAWPYGTSFIDAHGRTRHRQIVIPNQTTSGANGVNKAREMVGSYFDSLTSLTRGWYRDAAGTITAPIDPAGSISCVISGINDKGLTVGAYKDQANIVHGFVLKVPNTFFFFDLPGATVTTIANISNQGLAVGRFQYGDGIYHSYIARVSSSR